MSCSGNPSNCSFCGTTETNCAKVEVNGCTTNPKECAVCQGNGCVAKECTGNTATCHACQEGHYTTCRKAQIKASESEGIEPARPAPIA
ncbi:uncharacterized protein I303_105394 [Kwoniella dejecticola CBS 10117]|uniref:Uncharacterized protein n=1 Tax=Kwoniella dejecticola CBS 10117 TaxID=1296121 RepID=A0A1A6A2L7_9TREE|nr:uncharacterized protein I303_05161 [Kwoniella dejecticola CBS 10117]OBR84303.1 hypothetical protein I303_05161 [Kwoniella dejecticola CBS 10117]